MAEEKVDEAQLREYFGHFYEFVRHDDDYTITPEYASETVRKIFAFSEATDGIAQYTNMPPNYTIVQRINLGLLAVFGELEARRELAANRRRTVAVCRRSTVDTRWVNTSLQSWGDGSLPDPDN